MSEPFALHPRLAADTVELARWPLSRVLLMDDSRWPWLILVPQRPSIREIHELERADRATLIEEIAHAGRVLQDAVKADKMNVAMLGNMVPQLHVHIVARFAGDPGWPGPVWGFGSRVPYGEELTRRRGMLAERLKTLPAA